PGAWRHPPALVPEARRREIGLDAADLPFGKVERAPANALPLLFHLGRKALAPELVHQDLEPRLVLVVAPAIEIVDAQDRLEVAQEIGLGQGLANELGQHGRAALAAADVDLEDEAAAGVPIEVETDVVDSDRRPVVTGGRDRHLELARQKAEFRVE